MDSLPSDGDMAEEQGLDFQDDDHNGQLRGQLIQFHKRGSFCDTNLVVGEHEVGVHRVVLAAASSFFFDIFMKAEEDGRNQTMYKLKDVDWDGFHPLINYMYTGRLVVSGSEVRAVYKESLRLRLDAASKACADYLATRLTPDNCLGIRSIAAEVSFQNEIDEFIAKNIREVSESKNFYGLPRIAVEIVAPDDDVLTNSDSRQMFDQVLSWIKEYLSNIKNTLESLTEQVNVLYLNSNSTLSDCVDVEDQALKQNELVQDYKKLSKRKNTGQLKVKEYTAADVNGTAYFRKFSINPDSPIQEMEWSIIGSYKTQDRMFMSVAMVRGVMTTISVHFLPNVNNTSGSDDPDSPVHVRQSAFLDEHASFIPLQSMSINRCAFGLKVLRGKLFACGGYDRGECIMTSEMYDFEANTWTSVASLASPRGRFSIAEYKEKIYACGGSSGHNELKTVECYDPDANKWTCVTNAPNAKASPGLAVLDQKLYVVGGCMGQSTVTDCEAYDLETDKWKSIAPLNIPRFQVAVCVYGQKLFAIGGTNGWKCLSEVEIYNPEINTWQMGPPLNICRRGAGVSIVNGLIFVVGGNDGASALSSTEIYDPETRAWVLGPVLSIPRANAGVAALGTKLFAVGGFSGKKFLDTLEYLDVTSRSGGEWCSFLPLKAMKTQTNSQNHEQTSDDSNSSPRIPETDCHKESRYEHSEKQYVENAATSHCQTNTAATISTGQCTSRNA